MLVLKTSILSHFACAITLTTEFIDWPEGATELIEWRPEPTELIEWPEPTKLIEWRPEPSPEHCIDELQSLR